MMLPAGFMANPYGEEPVPVENTLTGLAVVSGREENLFNPRVVADPEVKYRSPLKIPNTRAFEVDTPAAADCVPK